MNPRNQIEFDFSGGPPRPDASPPPPLLEEARGQTEAPERSGAPSQEENPGGGPPMTLETGRPAMELTGPPDGEGQGIPTRSAAGGNAPPAAPSTGRDPPAYTAAAAGAFPFHAGGDSPPVPLLPPPGPTALGIRMVNEYVYCPRLFYYETVESVFVHNNDTREGGEAHKRVDTAKPGKLPKPEAESETGGAKTKGKTKGGGKTSTTGGSVEKKEGGGGENGSAQGTESEAASAETASDSEGNPAVGPDGRADDNAGGESPAADPGKSIHARSVELYSVALNVTAKLDLVEGASGGDGGGMRYTPVKYKKGRPREGDEGRELWDADRVQLTLQILLVRENGFPSEEGVVYYRETRQRVTFRPAPEDAAWAGRMAGEAHAARRGPMPPPLDHSPKCPRCSLVGICLPDETRMMAAASAADTPLSGHGAAHAQLDLPLMEDSLLPPQPPAPPARSALIDYVLRMPAPGIRRVRVDADLRRLIAPNPETRAPYLNTPGAWVNKSGEVITVKEKDKEIGRFLMKDLHHVALFGPVQISTGVVQTLCAEEIPLTYFTTGGWFYGITRGHTLKNVLTRIEQFRIAADPVASLILARRMIHGKIVNQRTLLMRNHLEPPRDVLHGLKYFAHAALMAPALPQLLGVEGNAASLYFSSLGGMLKPKTGGPVSSGPDTAPPPETNDLTDHREASAPAAGVPLFPFYPDSRNRRPPRDPVNALLSLTYSLLAKECTLACYAVGLDPYVGVLHQPRHGRPALALDLMEEFRPLLADSTVITLINNGMLTERDFVLSSHSAGLTPAGRKTVLNAWERRLADAVTHPLFGYKVSYRRAIELQTRILAKSLTGEIGEYIPFMTR